MTDDATRDRGSEEGPSTSAAELTYEPEGAERPSEAVVRAVASLTDTPALDLDPLYDVVDPEHLDGLFEGTGNGSVTFVFNGCQVTVTPDAVRVRERDGDAR